MTVNPYASPATINTAIETEDAGGDIQATRLTRFAANIVDGLLMMGVLIPIQLFTGFFERVQNQTAGVVESLAMNLAGIAVMLLLQGYLLYSRGQTVGKFLTKIQIVDFQSGGLLPFIRVFVFRYLWLTPISVVVSLIPGPIDDLVVNGLALINVLFIFGPAQRCLHDYIAGSKVVLFREGRQRI